MISEFAANLSDLEESQIAPREKLVVRAGKAERAEAGSASVRREIWALLLGAVLLVSMVEWVTYHRRVTV